MEELVAGGALPVPPSTFVEEEVTGLRWICSTSTALSVAIHSLQLRGDAQDGEGLCRPIK